VPAAWARTPESPPRTHTYAIHSPAVLQAELLIETEPLGRAHVLGGDLTSPAPHRSTARVRSVAPAPNRALLRGLP
jgi:hypothetical protein